MFQTPNSKTESLSSVSYTFSSSSMYGDWLIKHPVYSGWTCELFGMGNTITVRPEEGKVPNWFWRKMQYLCFGNKWVKGKN